MTAVKNVIDIQMSDLIDEDNLDEEDLDALPDNLDETEIIIMEQDNGEIKVEEMTPEILARRYGTKETPYKVPDKAPIRDNAGDSAAPPIDHYDLNTFISQTWQLTISNQIYWQEMMIQAALIKNGQYAQTLFDYLPEGQLRIMSNNLSQFADIKKTAITDSKVKLRIDPLTTDSMMPVDSDLTNGQGQSATTDLSMIDMVKGWLHAQRKKNDIQMADSINADNLIVRGTAFCLVEYNDRSLVGVDANTTQGEVELRPLDPTKVFPDIHAWKPDCSDMAYVYLWDRVPVESLRTRKNFHVIEKEFMNDYDSGIFQPERAWLKAQRLSYQPPVEQTVPYCSLYRKVWDPKFQRFFVLYSEFIPVAGTASWIISENVVLNIDEIPIAVCKTEINAVSYFSRSLVSKAIPKFLFSELMESVLANVALSAANPLLVAADGTGLTHNDIQALQTSGQGGGVILNVKEGNIQNSIMYLRKEPPDGVVEYAKYVKDEIASDLGTTRLSQGNAGSVQTGEAMAILENNSSKSDRTILQNWGIFQTRIAKLMFKIAAANYNDRQLQLMPEDPNSEDMFIYADYHSEMFKNLNIDFTLDGRVLTREEQEREAAQTKDLYINQQALGFEFQIVSDLEFIESQPGINKSAAKLRYAQYSAQVMEAKKNLNNQVLDQYGLVWQVVNGIYKTLSEFTGNEQQVMPFTPINALPENLQMQVVTTTQLAFMTDPTLAQIVDWDKVPFFLDGEMVSTYLATANTFNKVSKLENELQMLQPQFDMSQLALANSVDNATGGNDMQQGVQQAERGAAQPQPQGQSAPQPQQNAIQQNGGQV